MNTFKIEAVIIDPQEDPNLQYELEELICEIQKLLINGLFLQVHSISVRTHQI